MGLVNWDRFIKNLSRLTKPLETLLERTLNSPRTKNEQKAFTDIKKAFNDAPNLFIIRSNMKFGTYINASKYGLGARLYSSV